MDPSTLKYARTHEWIHLDGQTVTLGISDFAVKQLTDLVYIEFPPIGASYSAGETFGEVESVKAVSDLLTPVAGKIVEVNGDLENDLAVLSDDPFGKGWLVKMKVADPSTVDSLMDKAAYDAHCASQDH